MEKIRVVGGRPLEGTVRIGGAKNASLPEVCAALLTEKPVVLQANRKADILEALKWADEMNKPETGMKLKIILSGGIDAWKVADELKKRHPGLEGDYKRPGGAEKGRHRRMLEAGREAR